jgi:hypothetical protein
MRAAPRQGLRTEQYDATATRGVKADGGADQTNACVCTRTHAANAQRTQKRPRGVNCLISVKDRRLSRPHRIPSQSRGPVLGGSSRGSSRCSGLHPIAHTAHSAPRVTHVCLPGASLHATQPQCHLRIGFRSSPGHSVLSENHRGVRSHSRRMAISRRISSRLDESC